MGRLLAGQQKPNQKKKTIRQALRQTRRPLRHYILKRKRVATTSLCPTGPVRRRIREKTSLHEAHTEPSPKRWKSGALAKEAACTSDTGALMLDIFGTYTTAGDVASSQQKTVETGAAALADQCVVDDFSALSPWGLIKDHAQSIVGSLETVLLVQDAFLKRYTEPKPIGRGSFGRVYRARRNRSQLCGTDVAVKVSDADRTSKDQYALREVRLLGHIGAHPNVVELLDTACLPGIAVMLVLELFDGCLRRYIQNLKGRPMSSSAVEGIMIHLQRGLAYIHSRGCLHRDLSSANVLLMGDPQSTDAWRAVIADLGHGCISSARDPDHHRHHIDRAVSALPYRAPELILFPSEAYGAKVDVWSLGCIVADSLTSDVAFDPQETPGSRMAGCQEAQYLLRVHAFLKVRPPRMVHVMAHGWPLTPRDQKSFDLLNHQQHRRFLEARARLPPHAREVWDAMLQIKPAARMRSRDFPDAGITG